MSEKLHEGHRERMRSRIESGGIGSLQDHEVLEYLLFSFVPRRDTNALAHKLINEFGSLAGVMNADASHLSEVDGMTKNAALFLSSLPEVFRKYIAHSEEKISLGSRGAVREYLGKLFIGLEEERVYAVALDVHDNLIACDMLAKGSRAQVDIKAVRVADFAKKRKAVNVLIAHNHPGGSVQPSKEDVGLTGEICALLNLMDFNLQDHIIFNNVGEYFSFEENKMLQPIKNQSKNFKEGLWLQ